MSTPESKTVVLRQIKINRLNPDTGTPESGWEVTVKDGETGTVVPVFVPDSVYGQDQARTLIEYELSRVRSVHNLSF